MNRPTRARDPGLDIMESELAHVVASLRGGREGSQPSLRERVMRTGMAMLNPSETIRRNAPPPYRAA